MEESVVNVDVDELIETISYITNALPGIINSFSENSSKELKNCKSMLKILHRLPINSEIVEKRINIDKMKKICQKNKNYMKNVQSVINEFKEETKELEETATKTKENINNLEHKFSHLQAKQRSCQKKCRDPILVYKLLTNTHFCYDTKNVRGYTIGRTPDNILTFDVIPQKVSTKEITEFLYTGIKKVKAGSSKTIEQQEKENEEKQ